MPTNKPGWPKYPTLYELPVWPWLEALSRTLERPIGLGDVPAVEWDRLAALPADAVWLMGVWERSPAGARIAREVPALRAAYRAVLPDVTDDDVVGSPYCVHRYTVDARLGGDAGLAAARVELARRGLRLILDFVPNHLAVDHPWVAEHPEYFIQGDAERLAADPDGWFAAPGGEVLAHGRDPYFPAWTDTAQLDVSHPGTRRALAATLDQLAHRCDGLRCDMAMLALRTVFSDTWAARAAHPEPEREFWAELLEPLAEAHPGFLLLAEAYWELEWELQQLGFDFCYDKRLYDRLLSGSPEGVRSHLRADLSYQAQLVRFVENHDELRAASLWPGARGVAAAVVAATLPGARLFHHGQLDGARLQLPVQLGRAPVEEVDLARRAFYDWLLAELASPVLQRGEWQQARLSGWSNNQTTGQLLAWGWRHDEDRRLVVVNFGGQSAQGQVALHWPEVDEDRWELTDPFHGHRYLRSGEELLGPGLYVDLPAWGFHFFHLRRAN